MKKTKTLSIVEECRLYDKMWEWVDSKGNKITTSVSSNPITNKTTLPSNMEPYFKKLIAYFQKYLITDVICCDPQALSLEFPKTGNQLGLRILQMSTNNCVFCTLFDGSNNNEILAHSPHFQTWDQVLDWLIGQGLVRAVDRKLCETKLDGTPTKKESKTPVKDYFAEITESRAAAINFIKKKLATRVKIKKGKYADISTSYTQVVAKETSGNHHEIGTNPEYNYKAFTTKTSQFGIYPKDILHFIKTGQLVCTMPITESRKLNFTKEDLEAALDNLTESDDQGLELGDNFEDSDVMFVAGEPYGGTKWYVDKWADNLYIITSELWGQDGGGPEDGVYEEFESIEEVWDYISQLDPLSGGPALGPKDPESPDSSTPLAEYVDAKGTKITNSGHSSGWSLYSINSPEVCDGCGQIVEFNPNLKNTQMFFEPFQLKNGHKLCSDCMGVWINLPKGFVDKMNIISQYEIMAGDIDEFIENLKLTQQDIDSMIQEWNNKKKQGLITLQPQEIGSIETYFVEAVQKLGLKATKADFV